MPLALPLGDTDNQENRIVRLLRAWVSTLQPIEDTLIAIYESKDVDTAEGAALDLLGKLVGQSRGGLTDDDYRRYIRARVKTNKSNAVFEDLLAVAVLVLNDSDYTLTAQNSGTATVTFLVEGQALPLDLATILSLFLQKAKAGGVRLQLIFNSEPTPANWFYLDGPPGTLDGSIMFDTLP